MPFSATTPEHTAAYWDNFFLKFLKELYDADLVLAVLTDFNANVWYELGIRHALRRGTIMTIEEGQELPFDISHYGVIKYEDTIAGGATDFEEKLRSFVRRIEVEKPADSAVSEFLGAQKVKKRGQRGGGQKKKRGQKKTIQKSRKAKEEQQVPHKLKGRNPLTARREKSK